MNKLESLPYDESCLPTISIVFPVRSREKYLPSFLDCIYNLLYPKHLIELITIVNDSSDDSEKILLNFKKQHESEYNKIHIKRYDMGTPVYDSDRFAVIAPKIIQHNGVQRVIPQNLSHKVYKNLAKLRNILMHKASGDYIFSCDTDIMFPSDTLTRLLSADKNFISALICNGHIMHKKNGTDPYKYTNIMFKRDDGIYQHYGFYEKEGIIEVDNTGAIFLASRKAYKSGAAYGEHKAGEDIVMAQELQQRGFKLYCDCDLKCHHLMDSDMLQKYIDGETKY